MDSQADFVIVGGGLSGLVLATRLTENPNITVTVLEAGNDHSADPRLRTPALWLSVLGTPEFDWSYQSIPQKGLNGKVIPLSQGKLLGGSSAINGQAFVGNSKAAVDAWGEFGNKGWDWQTLAPYYQKFHTLNSPSAEVVSRLRLSYIDESIRAKDGPVQASFPDGASGNYLTICAALLHPLSRGSVHIDSADPDHKPIIDPRYLQHPVDLEVLARYFRFINNIVHTEPLSKYLKPNGRRSNGAPTDMTNLAEVKEYIKKAALSCWHPTSSCAMLPLEKGGVVNPELKVYGVENLRVVDSSILPIVTRGNPQTTVYAVAERTADIIRDTMT